MLFVGKLIPLHGLDTILAAAALAPEIPFRVVGSGQLEALLDHRPPNVEWIPWVEYEDLPGEIQSAGCALGIFGTGAKAGRVIPNKAFQTIACGDPARHRRHPGRARAAHRRPRRAARPTRRSGGARRRRAEPRLRPRPRRPHRCGGPRDLRGARKRGGAGSALAGAARACDRGDVSRPTALLSLAVCAFAAGMSSLAVLQQRAFETGRFDVGNLTQAVWSTAHGRFLEVTDLQGHQISRLGAHFDPLVAVFAPLWWLWPSPDLLLVVAGRRSRAGCGAGVPARPQAPRR